MGALVHALGDLDLQGDEAAAGVGGHVEVLECHVLHLHERQSAAGPLGPTRVLARNHVGDNAHTVDLDILDRLVSVLLVVKIGLIDLHVQGAAGNPSCSIRSNSNVGIGSAAAEWATERHFQIEVVGFSRWCMYDGQRGTHRRGCRSGQSWLLGDQAGDQRHAREKVALVWTFINYIRDLRRDVQKARAVNDLVEGHVPQAREHGILRGGVATTHHGEAICVHCDAVDLDERETLTTVLIVKVCGVQVQAQPAIPGSLCVAIESLHQAVGTAPSIPASDGGVHGALLVSVLIEPG
mmetsp:Transcript_58985/g.172673  ORF Transcript_58985/g.172673 Transcript_58985/m.172673 type:complete len:295 (+) Transcript_58985:341-1225(+)